MALSALTVHCGKLAPDSVDAGPDSGAGGDAGGASGGRPALAGEAGENAPGTGSSSGGVAAEAGAASEGGAAGDHSGSGPLEGGAGAAEVEPLVLRPERSVLISDPAVLEGLTFERVLWQIAAEDAPYMYYALGRSFVPRSESDGAPGPRCDDEAPAVNGFSTLSGFPVPCPAEAQGLLQLDPYTVWKPLSLTNRFDLAPEGGENCGEQHLSFYLDRQVASPAVFPSWAALRFSAVLPNPSPQLGLAGCRPIVDFWASLSRADYDEPTARARALEMAVLGLSPNGSEKLAPELQALLDAGHRPFMSAEHFGHRGRLQLLYLGDLLIWHFFEHALVSGKEGWVIRRPLTQSLPVMSLLSRDPLENPCAAQLLDSVSGLLDDDFVNQRMGVSPACFAGTDVTGGPTLFDGVLGLVPGGPYGDELGDQIRDQLSFRYPSYGLLPENIAARADFAGTCNGCHDLKGAPLSTPGTLSHVNPQRSEPCGTAGGDEQRTCYARSPLLKLGFLPRWVSLLQRFWDHPEQFPPLPEGVASTKAVDGTQLVQQNP